jgi:hypothetical protein
MMISAILRAGINVVLDWVLIFGNLGAPKLGIAGAAIATLTADVIGGTYYISAAFSKKLPVRLSLRAIRGASLKNYLSVIKIGIPAGLEEFGWNAGNILLLRFLNQVDPLAAGVYTIVMSITLIPALFFIAMGNAAMTLSGGGPAKAGLGRSGLPAPGPRPLLGDLRRLPRPLRPLPLVLRGAVHEDPAVLAQTGAMLLVCSFALFPKSANIIYGGAIRGMGDTRFMFLSQVFGTVFVLVMARLFIFNFKLATLGLFIAVFLDEFVRAFVNGFWFHRKIDRQETAVQVASLPARRCSHGHHKGRRRPGGSFLHDGLARDQQDEAGGRRDARARRTGDRGAWVRAEHGGPRAQARRDENRRVVGISSSDLYFAEVLHGIQERGWEDGFGIYISYSDLTDVCPVDKTTSTGISFACARSSGWETSRSGTSKG